MYKHPYRKTLASHRCCPANNVRLPNEDIFCERLDRSMRDKIGACAVLPIKVTSLACVRSSNKTAAGKRPVSAPKTTTVCAIVF